MENAVSGKIQKGVEDYDSKYCDNRIDRGLLYLSDL